MKIENSLTFFSTLSQPESSAIGVRNPVRTSSIRLMPSMPTKYSMWNAEIQSERSTKANGTFGSSKTAGSNPAHNTSVIAKTTSDTPSAR